MTDDEATLAYEANLAEWWESHIVAGGGKADRKRGLHWSLDRSAGGSSIHCVRLSERNADKTIARCIDESAAYGSAIWAYISEHSTPADALDRFKAAGFHHTKRFDVFIHDLRSLKAVRLPKGVAIERLGDLGRFSKSVAHPYVGPVTTANRRKAIATESALLQQRTEDLRAYLLSVDGVPASSVAVLRTGKMAGIYNVGTVDAQRGRGYAELLLNHVLNEAKTSGADAAGLIAVAKAERLYERVGFSARGWISFLYFSKTRLQARLAEAR